MPSSSHLPPQPLGDVVPHEELVIFVDDIFGNLRAYAEDRREVLVGKGRLAAGTDDFKTESLQLLLGAVGLEFLEERLLTQLFQVARLVGIRHIPHAISLLLELGIVLRQIPKFVVVSLQPSESCLRGISVRYSGFVLASLQNTFLGGYVLCIRCVWMPGACLR